MPNTKIAPTAPAAKKKPAKKSTAGTKKTTKKAKPTAKPTPHVAATKKSPRKTSPPPPQLTTEGRRKLLKPRDNYDELVERVARTWENATAMRVPGLSVSRLRKLLKDAMRARDKEQAMREKLERALRPLYDGRLLAEDKAWRALLDVNATVKLYARNNPALAETFLFLTEALTTSGGTGENGPAATGT